MADRSTLLAEHGRLRQARGDALLAGETFDDAVFADIERQLEHAEDRQGAERRRELMQAESVRVAFVKRRREEIVVADIERTAALDAAEAACRSLAVAVKRYFDAHRAIAASGARLNLDIPIPIAGRSPAILVSCLIGETLREVAEFGHIGNLELPRWPAVERPATWRAADAAADVAVRFLLETESPIIQGEHQ